MSVFSSLVRAKAILVPSGDQAGREDTGGSAVSGVLFEPSASIRKMSWLPVRLLVKAILPLVAMGAEAGGRAISAGADNAARQATSARLRHGPPVTPDGPPARRCGAARPSPPGPDRPAPARRRPSARGRFR